MEKQSSRSTDIRGGAGSGAPASQQQAAEKAHDFDPVCGMEVDASQSNTERVQRNGTTYYFCSSDCRSQFESAPEDFGA